MNNSGYSLGNRGSPPVYEVALDLPVRSGEGDSGAKRWVWHTIEMLFSWITGVWHMDGPGFRWVRLTTKTAGAQRNRGFSSQDRSTTRTCSPEKRIHEKKHCPFVVPNCLFSTILQFVCRSSLSAEVVGRFATTRRESRHTYRKLRSLARILTSRENICVCLGHGAWDTEGKRSRW